MENGTQSRGAPVSTTFYVAFSLLILEAAIIVVTNLLVYVLFARNQQLRRKTNICLISLATSDLLAGLVVVPIVITCNKLKEMVPCIAMDITQRFIATSTILHILHATMERYFKIRWPIEYKCYVTGKRIVLVLFGLWSFSIATSFVKLFFLSDEKKQQAYTIACMIVVGVLPFIISTLLNIHTIWTLSRVAANCRINISSDNLAQRNERRRKKQRRATLIYLAMGVSAALGWLPYFILPLIHSQLPLGLNTTLLLLKFATPFVNPLLYIFFKSDFNDAAKSLLSCGKVVMQTSSV